MFSRKVTIIIMNLKKVCHKYGTLFLLPHVSVWLDFILILFKKQQNAKY